MDPVSFAFTHFGRRVSAADPMDWIHTPGLANGPVMLADTANMRAGSRATTKDQMSIFISESEVRTFGKRGYPHLDIPYEIENMPRDFAIKRLFHEPEEPWMLISFGKATVTRSLLHLNQPDIPVTGYTNQKTIETARPRDLARIHAAFGDDPQLPALLALYRSVLAGQEATAKPEILARVQSLMADRPDQYKALHLLTVYNISLAQLQKFAQFSPAAATH